MKSSLSAVRNAFKTAITALGYSVYDRSRKVKDYPHVIIGEQTEQQNGDQGEFGQIATINVEIYNAWASDYGERATTDDMVNAILGAILTKPHTLQISGFDMPMLVLDNVVTTTDQDATHTIVTNSLRFRMQLFEYTVAPVLPPYLTTAETDEGGNAITLYFDHVMSGSNLTAALAKIELVEKVGNHFVSIEIFELTQVTPYSFLLVCDPSFTQNNSGIYFSYDGTDELIKSTSGESLGSITGFLVTNNIIY